MFLKGCSLRCLWCSNPENHVVQPQPYIKDAVEGTYGRYYTSEELTTECLKDKNFYEGKINDPALWTITDAGQIESLPGGITFSGGEALLQMPALVQVITALHDEGVHVAVETCLFCPQSNLEQAIQFIDFFYVDMKILDPDRCKEEEHGNLSLYLSILDTLLSWTDEAGKHKPVVIRIPVIGSYTDSPDNRNLVHDLISKYRESVLKIELIKEHNLGESKYKSLGMTMDYHGVDYELMETYKDELSDIGIMTEICKI